MESNSLMTTGRITFGKINSILIIKFQITTKIDFRRSGYKKIIMSTRVNSSAKKSSKLNLVLEEHHHALQVCFRIREGLENDVELERIRAYTNWFQTHYLEPHFEIEEKYIFPRLGYNVRVKRALANHRRIRKLLNCGCADEKVLNLLEEELAAHIRFEERILFKEISDKKELAELEKQHQSLSFSEENWKDPFWA